jgi:hypothetical protein
VQVARLRYIAAVPCSSPVPMALARAAAVHGPSSQAELRANRASRRGELVAMSPTVD